MDKDSDPIVGDAPAGGPAAWWAGLRSAIQAMRSRAPAVAARPKARQKPAPSAPDDGAKAQRAIHGAPAFWMAPFFLAFAAAFALPLLAAWLSPAAPRQVIAGVTGALPGPTQPLAAMISGWLWAPWWIALPASLMRLRAAWVTARASLDAVGWGMAAWALEGAAWLFAGREALNTGFSPAEQTGCWRLLVAEFVFLLVTATLFGPSEPRRPWFQGSAR